MEEWFRRMIMGSEDGRAYIVCPHQHKLMSVSFGAMMTDPNVSKSPSKEGLTDHYYCKFCEEHHPVGESYVPGRKRIRKFKMRSPRRPSFVSQAYVQSRTLDWSAEFVSSDHV